MDEAVRVVQSGFTRVISMCSAFSALAAFAFRREEAVEAIRSCKQNICHRSYNAATGAFIKTHQEWKEFLRHFGTGETLKQYGELNYHYKYFQPLVKTLVSEMASLTRKVSKSNIKDPSSKGVGGSLHDADSINAASTKVQELEFRPSPPRNDISCASGSPRRKRISVSLQRSKAEASRKKYINNSSLFSTYKNKLVLHSHPDAVHTEHHRAVNPKHDNPYRHPIVPEVTSDNETSNQAIAKRNESIRAILRRKSRPWRQPYDHVGYTPFPHIDEPVGETKTAGAGDEQTNKICLASFSMKILLIEPSEKQSKCFGYMLATQAKRYGINCNFSHVRGGKRGLKLSGFVKEPSFSPLSLVSGATNPLSMMQNKFSVIIVSANISDISWRSVVENARMNSSETLIYVVGECSGGGREEEYFTKATCEYGGNGFYTKPYSRGMASRIAMNIEKFLQHHRIKKDSCILRNVIKYRN